MGMRSRLLVAVYLAAMAVACGNDPENTPTGTGGTAGGGTGGVTGSGGTIGTGDSRVDQAPREVRPARPESVGGTTAGTGGSSGSGGGGSGGSGGAGRGGSSGSSGAGGGSGGSGGGSGGSSGRGGMSGAAAGGRGGAGGSTGGAGGRGGGGSGGSAGSGGGGGGAFHACPTDGTVCRIMPFGDSITDGYNGDTPGGYRVELFKVAHQAGKNITFVGSSSTARRQSTASRFPPSTKATAGGRSRRRAAGVGSPRWSRPSCRSSRRTSSF